MKVNLANWHHYQNTEKMLQFMIQAEAGDDVCKDDPTVNMLQTKAALLFGMKAVISDTADIHEDSILS